MNTLFHAKLSEREFSSHLLHVADLLAWAESKRLHLRTSPALDGFEFVQVEALLCAIERQSQDLTPDQAAEIVLNHPILKNDPVVTRYPDDVDPTTCRWLLGADAHKKWRDLLSGAIERHELALLDFASKLPIDTAPATDTATPAPDELDYSLLATPAELIDAYGKWGLKIEWFDDLNSHKWLSDARRRKGQGQRGQVVEPLFCPYAVMTGLVKKVRKEKRVRPDTAWRTLEHKFPRVHAAFADYDTRERTGD